MGSINNPWNVPSIQDFLFFCCPECDSKVKNSQDFINHALLLHEEAKDSFSMQNEIKNTKTKIDDNQVENKPVKISIMKRKLEEDPEFTLDSKVQKLESNEDQDEFTGQVFDDDDEIALEEPEGIFICDNCDNCDKMFKTRIELDNHLKEVHSEEWKCDTCDSSFPSEYQLKYHVKVTHKLRTRNVCHTCGTLYPNYENFRSHVENMHKVNEKYNCDKCDTVVSKHYKIWMKHTKHCNGINDNVSKLKQKYSKKKQFLRNEQLFKCDSCDSSFVTENELTFHVKLNHKGRVRNVCYNCETLFEDSGTFSAHVEAKHKVDERYTCDKCDTFKSKTYKVWLKHTKYCIEKTEEKTQETNDTKLEIKCDTSLTLELDTNSHTKCDTTDNKAQESKFDMIEDHVEDKVSQVKEDDTKCDTKQNEAEESKCDQNIEFDNSNKDNEMKCDTKSNSDVTMKSNNDQLLKCYKCDIMFMKVSELNYHNKINHKARVKNVCFNCEMMFEDNESF